ncbi:hypothetical protein SSX86_007205 [Deinandra increscens subsp. villosa]|uniref:BAR domain-containing protein n=1 Tax=Deinandra increscens subsp. villosa TaxID=3103831 RepID=A0AAP0H7K8_9ASTR
MKSPFKKLLHGLGLGHEKHPQLDELSQASQDMQDMKDCYDTLLSSAAATANSAYEFSESLREMGDCLLKKTSLNDDQDSGRALLMLGKVQFEIQKLVDNYRSHISRTITVPSESLLKELHIVEEMKRQCDEKRMWYDEMKIKHKERRRLGSGKGEYVSSNQVRAAKQEFEEDATLFVFRTKSLKGGQSRSLLTQAARHHAAQMTFFRKALKSLEAIDPHIQLVTKEHHIDCQFSGLEDDDDRDSLFLTDDEQENGELSFDYRRDDPTKQVSSLENSMELKKVELTFPQVSPLNLVKQEQRKPLWNSSKYNIAVNTGCKSAPLSARTNMDPSEKFSKSSSRKLNTHVLPTPLDKNPRFTNTQQSKPTSTNMWHSSPLELKKQEEKRKFSGSISPSNNYSKPTPLPSPLRHPCPSFVEKEVKRYAFSGPIAATPSLSNSLLYSGSLLNSGKLVSGSFMSSPKISELHELPRPPANEGFSAPLVTSTSKSTDATSILLVSPDSQSKNLRP